MAGGKQCPAPPLVWLSYCYAASHDVAPAGLLQALWDSQHTWAGEQMYDLAISLRGFYLKVRGSSWWEIWGKIVVGKPHGGKCITAKMRQQQNVMMAAMLMWQGCSSIDAAVLLKAQRQEKYPV